jgi:hypothetical protein
MIVRCHRHQHPEEYGHPAVIGDLSWAQHLELAPRATEALSGFNTEGYVPPEDEPIEAMPCMGGP